MLDREKAQVVILHRCPHVAERAPYQGAKEIDHDSQDELDVE